MRSTFRSHRTTLAAVSIVAAAGLGLAGCSADTGTRAEMDDETSMGEEPMATEEMEADPAANLEDHRKGWDGELDKLVALLEGGA